MTLLALVDPAAAASTDWPAGAEQERAYIDAFASRGSTALISNLRTRVMALRSGARVFPVTVNDAEYGDAYVCLPHTAYALYAKDELRIVDAGPWTPALAALASGAGAALRRAQINRVVHVNNWMLSTNLHGCWRGEEVGAIRTLLTERFPAHALCVRSLNRWSDPDLCARFEADGWRLLPARQIYVTDDLAAEWAPRRDTRRDLALLERSPYRRDDLHELRPGDAQRIADLYALLYLDRYSQLNPAFTADFIDLTHRAGLFTYRGFRDGNGALATVVGCFIRGGVLTTPIVGYDTARPPEEGLYRLCSLALAQMAMERGLKLNGSAGAASFKRNRGARAVIEYSAYYVRHLPLARRSAIAALEQLLNRIALPIMTERGL
ncbi:MAG TPA: hypothetical protein VEA80_11445 [Vitreimonas sp.]|uniref:hypothetical protein n=1 Tax=Vitreimonas sp. TaxID=3069702 RepID=UPI002D249FA7|nr:hypothetical protein [Vitreimonas sp.]HYD88082.1 hypothetical protein [Vitreimonas sp.]